MVYHGYNENSNAEWCRRIKNMFEQHLYNVILIDWSRDFQATYEETVENLEDIAAATVSKWPIENTSQFLTIFVLGYDLGAHVAGLAAREYTARTKKPVDLITTLDASGHMFENTDLGLRRSDADTIVSFHTNDGGYGFNGTFGENNYYTSNLSWKCRHLVGKYEIPGRKLTEKGKIQASFSILFNSERILFLL